VDFLKRVWRRVGDHNVSMVAAGVAFYAMLAIVPGLIAMVAVYALLSDPGHVQEQVAPVARVLPTDVASLLDHQLHDAVAAKRGGVTIGLVASLLGTLWAASGGVNALRDLDRSGRPPVIDDAAVVIATLQLTAPALPGRTLQVPFPPVVATKGRIPAVVATRWLLVG